MRRGLTALATAALIVACTGRSRPTAPLPAAVPTLPAASAAALPHLAATAPAVAAPALEPILLVTDPTALATLDQHGYALGDWFLGRGSGRRTNAELAENDGFGQIMRAIAADLARLAGRDPHAGVKVSRFPHRLFDERWLRSAHAHFELAAVVNRLDRAPFAPASCGEIRLIYRLAYATVTAKAPVRSRLPMTLGIELAVPRGPDGCLTAARRWLPPNAQSGEALGTWLASPGAPLDPATLGDSRTARHRLVVNVQEVRWPSAVRPDLGGHAEYLLRAFRRGSGDQGYAPEPLESTPDAARLAREPKLKAELLSFLLEEGNLKAVDVGVPFLPERFLATRAESVTPRGPARRQNRPFSALFSPADFAKVDFSALPRVRSALGLLRRLDELTCPGCHESRSIAGFHLLGDDPADTPAGNAVMSGTSPHVLGDLARRAAYARALLDAGTPDAAQPFAERSSYAGYGAHCGLGSDPTFTSWRCREGLTCQAYDAPASDGVGQCLPAAPRAAGDPCEIGPIAPNVNAHQDRVTAPTRIDCAANAVCNVNAVGFPGGMCTEGCGGLSPSSICGSIAVLDPFNACVARGEPFSTCLTEHVRPAGLRACSAEDPCRDDYVCARAATGGACIPPYFLFQLRVDGHPEL